MTETRNQSGEPFRSQVAEKLRTDLVASVPLYDPTSPDAVETRAWDALQHDLQCCGVSQGCYSMDILNCFGAKLGRVLGQLQY